MMMKKQYSLVLTEFACQLADEFLQSASTEEKNQKGLSFTPRWIAELMARQLKIESSAICFLDPGAGTGILTAALCDTLLSSPKSLRIHADVSENNLLLIPYLKQTLQKIKQTFTDSPHQFSFKINQQSFIHQYSHLISTTPLFSDARSTLEYDMIITFPPFYKYPKLNQELQIVNNLIHGQSNTLAFFLAFSRQLLKENGQMVGIIPRTCCSGLYYKGFRKWLIEPIKIEQIHLFPPEIKTFSNLFFQENVILKIRKTRKALPEIKITSSTKQNSETNRKLLVTASSLVQPRDKAKIIPVPVNSRELQVVELVRVWGQQLRQLGYRAVTGPLDPPKVREFLITEKKNEHLDLTVVLEPNHLQQFTIEYPLKTGAESQRILITAQSINCLVENQRYVLVRRYDRKLLPRRIEAAYYAPALVAAPKIGIVKSLLFIQKQRGKLSLLESLGIMALLNSELINRYLYILNGIRRVSASELNQLPFPGYEKIIKIGEKINQFRHLDLATINSIVFKVLELSPELEN